MIYSIIFLLTIICTIFSFAFAGTPLGDVLQIAAQVVVAALFVIAVLKYIHYKPYNIPNIFCIWIYCLVALLIIWCVMPSYAKVNLSSSIRELFIPLAISFSAYMLLNYSEKKFSYGMQIIAILSIFAIIYSLLNSGGIEIESYYREGLSKNQTAPFYSVVGLICVYLMIKDRNLISKFIFIAGFAACLTFCVVVRARTATIGLLMISLAIFWVYYRQKLFIYLPIIACIAVVFFFNDIKHIYEASFLGNSDVNDIDSLTSGRVGRNEDSFQFYLNHPLEGAVSGDSASLAVWYNYETPHLFILWKLVQFGLIYSIPFLIVYFKLWPIAFRQFFSKNKTLFISGVCLAMALLESLAEYSAPFGPGTSFMLCYMLFGNALRVSASESNNINVSNTSGGNNSRISHSSIDIQRF